jgi:hypothetical protein
MQCVCERAGGGNGERVSERARPRVGGDRRRPQQQSVERIPGIQRRTYRHPYHLRPLCSPPPPGRCLESPLLHAWEEEEEADQSARARRHGGRGWSQRRRCGRRACVTQKSSSGPSPPRRHLPLPASAPAIIWQVPSLVIVPRLSEARQLSHATHAASCAVCRGEGARGLMQHKPINRFSNPSFLPCPPPVLQYVLCRARETERAGGRLRGREGGRVGGRAAVLARKHAVTRVEQDTKAPYVPSPASSRIPSSPIPLCSRPLTPEG